MPIFKKLQSILKQMDSSLWFASCLIVMGASFSSYYGHNLESAMNFALNDQSVILRTFNDIEKFEIRVRNHFYITDKNRISLNLEEIKNLKTEIDYLMKSLSEKSQYPQVKLLNKRWRQEVSTIVYNGPHCLDHF